MSDLYRPSNGTEGMDFMAVFCDRCKREAGRKVCDLIGNSMAYEMDDPKYPKEWVYDAPDVSTAKCTAFELK